MPDKSNIRTWYEFALQQIAAESYLDLYDMSNPESLMTALKEGNHQLGYSPLKLYTKMTDSQASWFVNTFEIVDHLPNTASGFSATLMRNGLGEYTLSFRSTEFKSQDFGGDEERDGLGGADGEIGANGFAFGQIVDMETYYEHLKLGERFDTATKTWIADAKLDDFKATFGGAVPAADALNVTGYSLGGHLATVFTELHTSEVKQTFTFNGAGRGKPAAGYSVSDVIDGFRQVLANPASVTITEDSAFYPAWLAAKAAPPAGQDENIYDDARYVFAKAWASNEFGTIGSAATGSQIGLNQEVNQKILQIYGHADTDDVELVANSGVHSSQMHEIFIEDQPDWTGTGYFAGGDSTGDLGTTHSIVLLIDTLATIDMLQGIDSTLSQAQAEAIFSAASNQRARGNLLDLTDTDEAESDSLGEEAMTGCSATPATTC